MLRMREQAGCFALSVFCCSGVDCALFNFLVLLLLGKWSVNGTLFGPTHMYLNIVTNCQRTSDSFLFNLPKF